MQTKSDSGKRIVITGAIVIAIIVAVLVAIGLRIDNWERDWNTNFAELQADAEDPSLRPIEKPQSPTELADEMIQRVEQARRWSFVSRRKDGDAVIVKLTHATTLLGLVDDVEVTIEPTAAGSLLTARSQSRIGKGDLGQNPRNLRELTKLLED